MSYDDYKAKNQSRIDRNGKNKFKPKGSMTENFKNMKVNKGKIRQSKKLHKIYEEDNDLYFNS